MVATHPPIALVVLDGWGISAKSEHNAIRLGHTPSYDELLRRYPHGKLVASGEAVGLPAQQMGNSEVGHMNLGAGRVVYQDLTRIDQSIDDGNFFTTEALVTAMRQCTTGERALHLIGLVSDGGVHSHLRHLMALIDLAKRQDITKLFIHALTDGRDAPPNGAVDYLSSVETSLQKAGIGRVASVSGRYYAMDRDKRWQRTQQAYDAITSGLGRQTTNIAAAVIESYANGITDEFIEPTVVIDSTGNPIGTIKNGDVTILFNFRADRARQLTSALAFGNDRFTGFERKNTPETQVTTLTEYDATYGLPVAFKPESFSSTIAEVLSAHGRTNLRLAETEKYAHVTYFFNGGEETPYVGEDRILVPSPQVPTYDLKPEMNAAGITNQFIEDVKQHRHDVIICNFANADMVGHTGKLEATVEAVSMLDTCVARIVQAVTKAHGTVMITADHGNAEKLWDRQRNGPHTAHTNNPVPILLINEDAEGKGYRLHDGSLRDVAPTLLSIAGIDIPAVMTGSDLRTWVD